MVYFLAFLYTFIGLMMGIMLERARWMHPDGRITVQGSSYIVIKTGDRK